MLTDLGIELARLHSMAVDFAKTGAPAQMTNDLRVERWPHFMEKVVPKERTYASRKILGQLYDKVERIDFQPVMRAAFDQRILDAYKHSEDRLMQARRLKLEYDASIRRIMNQLEIETEFEVFSTFMMAHSSHKNAYKAHEEIGELSAALKDQYRTSCLQTADANGPNNRHAFAAAMYTVTAQEIAQYLAHESGEVPLISFPWVLQDILGKIAKGIQETSIKIPVNQPSAETQQPIAIRPAKRPTKSKLEAFNQAPDIQTAGGTLHQGDLIELFDDIEPEPESFHGGADESPQGTRVGQTVDGSGDDQSKPDDQLGEERVASMPNKDLISAGSHDHGPQDADSQQEEAPREIQVDADAHRRLPYINSKDNVFGYRDDSTPDVFADQLDGHVRSSATSHIGDWVQHTWSPQNLLESDDGPHLSNEPDEDNDEDGDADQVPLDAAEEGYLNTNPYLDEIILRKGQDRAPAEQRVSAQDEEGVFKTIAKSDWTRI